MDLDIVEIIKRILKYLIEGTAVALAAYYVPQGKEKLSLDSICIIGITAAATFAILDMYTPDISLQQEWEQVLVLVVILLISQDNFYKYL